MATFLSNPKNRWLKDVIVRATKTWVQAFLATLAVSVVTVKDVPTAKAALVGAVAFAISATWNTILAVK